MLPRLFPFPLLWLLVSTAPLCEPGAAQEGWWAYRPLQRPDVPAVEGADWCRNPIDAFILRGLETKGLRPAREAAKRDLVRRLTYDLTGLPPTPAAVRTFVADPRPDAWERLVDRLLASPQYGVKWGRHWLDLVRYAETDSYERDRRKPAAWRYRDWVIEAFNSDKPYDRFLIEQLAGDELERPNLAQIIATGYYRLGIWDDEPTDTLQAVYDDYDSILDTTSRVMLGISMGCARCHDHKKDPIPQRDYYRMLALFEGIKPYKVGRGNATTPRNFVKKYPVDLGADQRFAHREQEWRRQRRELVQEVQNLAREVHSHMTNAELAEIDRAAARGLVVHLPFDGPESPGCRIAGAVRENGRGGQVLHFSGGNHVVRLPRPVTGDFTVALWFRADRKGRGSAEDRRWFRGSGLLDGGVRGVADDFGVALVADRVAAGTGKPDTFVSSPPGYADGQWHQVAFTRDRESGRITLYVDGVRVDRGRGGTQALDGPADLTIGRLREGRGGFQGAIDEVRIYDRALAGRDVLGLFHGGGFDTATESAIRARIGVPEAERYAQALHRLVSMEPLRREMVDVLCVQEDGAEIAPSFVRIRGNVHAKGPEVRAGFPAVLGGGEPPIRPRPGSTSGRRRALADWIVSDKNPLTARVIANRLWQYHFGRGIVRTPNDFGRLGELPTHPELLDWLATELVRRGWRLKAMHRLIVSSAAYRMSSEFDTAAARKDPTNDLFWRFDMRRLTAEELRDSILAVSGVLNPKLGGPGVYPKMPEEVLDTASRPDQAWGRSSEAEANRRSIFIHAKRSLLTPLLVAFDLADTDASCPVRFETTQPTQALTMLNSEFLQEQAAEFAARLGREADRAPARLARGFWLVTQRPPSTGDIDDGLALLQSLRERHGRSAAVAWKDLCLVLLNLNEFLYLD